MAARPRLRYCGIVVVLLALVAQTQAQERVLHVSKWLSSGGQSTASGSGNRFFELRVNQPGEVRIELASTADSFVVLTSAAGAVLASNDNYIPGSGNLDARIVRALEAGTYGIVAGTSTGGVEASFTLEVTAPDTPELRIVDSVNVPTPTRLHGLWRNSAGQQTERQGNPHILFNASGTVSIDLISATDAELKLRNPDDFQFFDDDADSGLRTNPSLQGELDGRYELILATRANDVHSPWELIVHADQFELISIDSDHDGQPDAADDTPFYAEDRPQVRRVGQVDTASFNDVAGPFLARATQSGETELHNGPWNTEHRMFKAWRRVATPSICSNQAFCNPAVSLDTLALARPGLALVDLYERSGDGFVFRQQLEDDINDAGSRFGEVLAINGDVLAVHSNATGSEAPPPFLWLFDRVTGAQPLWRNGYVEEADVTAFEIPARNRVVATLRNGNRVYAENDPANGWGPAAPFENSFDLDLSGVTFNPAEFCAHHLSGELVAARTCNGDRVEVFRRQADGTWAGVTAFLQLRRGAGAWGAIRLAPDHDNLTTYLYAEDLNAGRVEVFHIGPAAPDFTAWRPTPGNARFPGSVYGRAGWPALFGDFGAGSGAFIYRSLDEGLTWQPASTTPSEFLDPFDNPFTPDIRNVVLDPQRPDNVFAYGVEYFNRTEAESYGYVFRSTDGGLSFDVVLNRAPRGDGSGTGAFDLIDGVLYAGTQGGAYVSSDQGATWTNTSFGASCAIVNGWFAVDGLVIAASRLSSLCGAPVHASIDQGRSWFALNAGLPGDLTDAAIYEDPNDPNTLYLYASRNGSTYRLAEDRRGWTLVESNGKAVPSLKRERLLTSTKTAINSFGADSFSPRQTHTRSSEATDENSQEGLYRAPFDRAVAETDGRRLIGLHVNIDGRSELVSRQLPRVDIPLRTRQAQWRVTPYPTTDVQLRYALSESCDTATAWTSTRSTRIAPTLADGRHTLCVQQRFGATWVDLGARSTQLDTNPPTTSHVAAPTTGGAQITLTCRDGSAGTGCDRTFYQVNDGPDVLYTAPFVISDTDRVRYYSVDATGLQEAARTLEAGNFTRLTLDDLQPRSILLISESGDLQLNVGGRLSVPGDEGAVLTGASISIDLYAPDGSLAHTFAISIADAAGFFANFDLISACRPRSNCLDSAGAWRVQARFEGSALLAVAESTSQTVLVGRSAGYALVVQGESPDAEGEDSHFKTALRVVQKLGERNIIPENLFFLAGFPEDPRYATLRDSGTFPPVHRRGGTCDGPAGSVCWDGAPSRAAIREALATMGARMATSPAPAYIVFVDHGTNEVFHLGSEQITPADLDTWLDGLEGNANLPTAAEEKPRVVILGYCYSGSFLPALAAPGRVVISSAAAEEESYKGLREADDIRVGEYFLEELFTAWGKEQDLRSAFALARDKTERFTRKGGDADAVPPFFDGAVQHPLLEDDGRASAGRFGSNVLVEGIGDGERARDLYLGVSAQLTNSVPGDITAVTPTRYLPGDDCRITPSACRTELFLNTNDFTLIDVARVEVREPDLVLPDSEPNRNRLEQRSIDNPVALRQLSRRPNVSGGNRFATTLAIFDTPGRYEAYYTVRDNCDAPPCALSASRRSIIYKNRPGNEPPLPFALIDPLDATQPGQEFRTTGLFTWQATADAETPDSPASVTYNLIIARNQAFTDVVVRQEDIPGPIAAVDDDANLVDGETYYWRVEAVDRFGARTTSSNTGVFIADNKNAFGGPDLSVSQTADRLTASPGRPIAFTVTVTNLGSEFTTERPQVTLTNQLPSGSRLTEAPASCTAVDDNQRFTCDLGRLGFNETETVRFRASRDVSGRMTNRAWADADLPDDNYANNESVADVQLSNNGGDRDSDGVADDVDNCPDTANPDQIDGNDDGAGDACSGGLRRTIVPGFRWPGGG